MNERTQKKFNVLETHLHNLIISLRSRLAEVEKERDELKAVPSLLNQYERAVQQWHTQQSVEELKDAHEASLAKLGNEIFKLREQRDNYKTIAEEATKAGLAWFDELKLARAVVEAVKISNPHAIVNGVFGSLTVLRALEAYDATRATEEKK